MRIAFFGGCILKQNKLKDQNHFHALVLEALNNKLNSNIESSLQPYWHYNNLGNQLANLLKQVDLDFVVLFMRAFPLVGLMKPLIKYKDSKGKLRWTLHPRIIGLKRYQKIDFASEEGYTPNSTSKNRFKNFFRNLNFGIG